MKKIIILISFISCIVDLSAQQARYLEKKDDQQAVNNDIISFQPTLSEDGSHLAISISKTDMSSNYKQLRPNYSSKIINLQNGRVELRQKGLALSYLRNGLFAWDFATLDNRWIDTKKFLDEVANAPSYMLNLASNEKKYLSKPPAGYYPQLPVGKYWFFMSTDLQKSSAVLAEERNNRFEIIREFDIRYGKLSPDSAHVYGFNTKEKRVSVFDIQSGKALMSVKFKEIPIDVTMLADGRLFCEFMDWDGMGKIIFSSKILSTDGLTTLKQFKNTEVVTEMLDHEQALITVSPDGTIKLLEVASAQIIAETKDTYIDTSTGKKAVSGILKIKGGDFFLISYSTGIMSLFNTKERKVVASIFSDMDDWAIIAKDGRVDGTSAAFDKLEWRTYEGDKLVKQTSLESTFDKYYTPRLLYSIISGEQPVSKISIGDDLTKIPTLAFEKINGQNPAAIRDGEILNYTATGKNVTIGIKASTHRDEIKEVRLYQNGKLVGLQPAHAEGNYTFSVSLNSVYGDKNSLYAIASTKQGIDSEKLKAIISYSSNATAKAKLYMLVVGVNKYQNPKYQLNYALPDAQAFKKQFADNPSSLFESSIVKSLFDGEVTKASITAAFKELSAMVKEQDMFIFYYAGHGTVGGNTSLTSEFYIVPFDVTQLYGNENILKEKALSASEIKKLTMEVAAQKQVFIIDACHSAGALESVATRGAAEEKAIGQLARSTGTFWLTAAGSDQFATEFEKLGHGVFTYSLLEALQGKDSASATDGTITVRELSAYIEQRVPELSQQYKGSPQYPASFSFGNDFPIVIQPVKK